MAKGQTDTHGHEDTKSVFLLIEGSVQSERLDEFRIDKDWL